MEVHGNIIIRSPSALIYWLHANPDAWDCAQPVEHNVFSESAKTLKSLESFNTRNPLFGDSPIHLMVPDKSYSHRSKRIVTHYSRLAYPPGSFYSLGGGLFIASPELAFLQMGEYLNTVQLTEAATNLCARFYTDIHSARICRRSRQLVSIASLAAYLHRMHHVNGAQKSIAALRNAHEGSESPMETAVQLLLGMPKRLGGAGFPAYVCNHEISPGRHARLAAQRCFRADICWPERRVIVEYDGKAFHRDAHRDKRRINALEALGWRVFSLTSSDLFDLEVFELFLRQVARAIGYRMQLPKNWRSLALELRRELDLLPGSSPDTCLFPKLSYRGEDCKAVVSCDMARAPAAV